MSRNHALLGVTKAVRLAAAVALVGSAPLFASDLTVEEDVVNSGDHAAKVEVESSCTAELHLTVSNDIDQPSYTACSSITVDGDVGAEMGLPDDVAFTAGDLVILRNGFSVKNGASISIQIDRELFPDAWVQDDTPDGETVYGARFYVNGKGLTLDEDTDRFYHFIAFDADGDPVLRVGVKRDGTERRLFLEAFEDDGGFDTTEGSVELELPVDADPDINLSWHFVEVGWEASSGPGNNDGQAFICVDQETPPTGCQTLPNLDNDTAAVDFVRWGAVDVPSSEDLGTMHLDDFESRRSLNIGGLPP